MIDLDALVDTARCEWGAQQKHDELVAFAGMVLDRGYRRMLEIGTYSGGTARFFDALGLSVVAVDQDLSHVQSFSSDVQFVEGDSVKTAGSFPDGMFDVVFIDGDHSLEAVTADWEAYRSKVRAGGILAFHDVREHLGAWGGLSHVKVLWDEIKTSGRYWTREFVYGEEQCAGIGVVLID